MNKPLVVLALTTASFASASVYLWHESRTQREQVRTLQAQLQSMRSHQAVIARDETPPVSTPEQASASTQIPAPRQAAVQSFTSLSAPIQPRAVPALDPHRMRERFMRQQQALMKDPEYVAALRSQQRMMLGRQYPYLAEDLGLSPETEARLLDLLAAQQIEQMNDANAFDPALRSDPSAMADYQRKMEERTRANQEAIAEVLGDQGMERWRDYQSTIGARFRARQLSQALDAAGMPLGEDQKRALRQALAEHERQMQQEAQNYATKLSQSGSLSAQSRLKLDEEQLERTEGYYERARNSVSGILTSEQLEQYKNIHEQELAMRRAQLRIQRAQLDANGGEEASEPQMGFVSGGFAPAAGTVIVSDD